jgi:hypothetical protein
MVFLLWRREAGLNVAVRRLGLSPDLLTVTWVDYDHFMWIERGNERVGALWLSILRTPDYKSYELTNRVRLRMNALNEPVAVKMDIFVHMNQLFEMETFQGSLELLNQKVAVEACADADALYYRIEGPPMLVSGGSAAAGLKLDQPVMLADAVQPVVTQNGKLRPGTRWTTLATDPILGRFNVPVEVRVGGIETMELKGRSVEAFRVTETTGEFQTLSWYSPDGKLLKSDIGNGLKLLVAEREEVYQAFPELQ